jgi:hypothetical protein
MLVILPQNNENAAIDVVEGEENISWMDLMPPIPMGSAR